MGFIDERAKKRRLAVQAELRAKYPALFPKPIERFDRSVIALGRDQHNKLVLLPERPRLEHSLVIGTTGGGKSRFIEHCIRQDIAAGRGVFLVDPHGEHPTSSYRSTLAWLVRTGYIEKRQVHLIDPNAPSHTVGFNPLSRPDAETDLSVLAGVTLEAFSRAWGGEDTTGKPTIERVLTATFAALAELGLTLVEAPLILDRKDRHSLRAHAVETVTDRYTRDELLRLHELSLDDKRKRDFDLEVVGPINRIARFVRPPAIRAMIGQTEHLLDFQQAFDEGHVILCNLSGGSRVYERDADLLGRLLTRMIFFHAKRRAHPERPFFVYLDECHRYLSGDLENILAESRKYGVAAVLAHQWLEQAATEGDNMLAAIRNATNVKVVFRIKDPKEAEDLAHTVVPLDLEVPVRALIRPTVVGYRRIRLGNESTGMQSSMSTTRGVSIGETKARGKSVASATGESVSEGVSRSHARGENTSEGYTSAVSTGMSTSEGFTVGKSRGESVSEGVTSGVSTGESSSEGYASGASIGTSISEGMSSGHSHGTTAAHGVSTTAVTSAGASISTGAVMLPMDERGFLAPPEEPTILTESASEGTFNGEAFGSSSNTMQGVSSSFSEAMNTAHGRSSSLSESASQMRGTSSSLSEAKSRTHGTSSATSEAKSTAHGVSSSLSEGKSHARGQSVSFSGTRSHTVGRSSSVSHATSDIYAQSTARSHSKGTTLGESTTAGTSEALEPILEDRPSSVYSKEGVLYMAAQTLRNLPTGSAFLNYVGARGMIATLLVVPPIRDFILSSATFAAVRQRVLEMSSAAIPADIARAYVEERERAFIAFTQRHQIESEEPASFRVASRAGAPRRGSSSAVGRRRSSSCSEGEQSPCADETPLADGSQKRAQLEPCQGSRSPEATAQSAALDRDERAPRKARRAANGEKCVSGKV